MVLAHAQCHGRAELVHDAPASAEAGKVLHDIVDLLNSLAPVEDATQDPPCEPGSDEPASAPRLDPKPLDPDDQHLFFAGRPMLLSQPLSATLGSNEKTRAIVWVHPCGMGRPPREPALSPQEERAVMAWQHARQQAQRAAEADAVLGDGGQGWADPGSLRSSFHGLNTVRLR